MTNDAWAKTHVVLKRRVSKVRDALNRKGGKEVEILHRRGSTTCIAE